ncbi:hypothetical protein BKN14_00270 [Candidatus Gracilibacteria bacterium HOT-871]|nr:hypothetical protein BKN14_00270 [Candidatus Gracilibacteria bacterium HOT-871]
MEIEKKQIYKLVGFILIIFLTIFIAVNYFNLKNDIIQAKEILNTYNTEISILEENKNLSKKWQELESVILEKREIIKENQAQLELLEKNKFEVEAMIQENRQKISGNLK